MLVEVYTKKDCPHCVTVKSALHNAQVPFIEKTLDVHFTREQILERYPTAKTFPIVVVDGFYIGGSQQLQEMLTKRQKNTAQFLDEHSWNGA